MVPLCELRRRKQLSLEPTTEGIKAKFFELYHQQAWNEAAEGGIETARCLAAADSGA